MTRTHTISLFFFVSTIASIALFFLPETNALSSVPTKTVTTISATQSSFQPEATFSGFVSGTQTANLAPRSSGFVARLLKEEGDYVARGETLAVLEASEITTNRQSALDALHAFDVTVSQTMRYYKQKVDEAETSLDHTKTDYQNGDASAHDVEAAKEALKSAKRLRDAEIANAKANRTPSASTALLSTALADNLIIRAPFSGTVTRKYLSIGSIASPEQPIYSIASTDMTEILVSLPNTIARTLSAGASVHITSDTTETELPGYIFSLAPSHDAMTQQSLARIRINKAASQDALKLGEHTRIRFPVGAPHSALMIPEVAIEHIYDDTRVSVVENGVVRQKTVILGQNHGTEQEILSGLEPEEHVIIEGMHTVRPEQSVTEHYVER